MILICYVKMYLSNLKWNIICNLSNILFKPYVLTFTQEHSLLRRSITF